MIVEYLPLVGFKLNFTILFEWKEDRKSIRDKFKNQHEADDRIHDVAQFFGGDTSHNFEQRRDIYKDIDNQHNYFFLIYDENDKLKELEIHCGVSIIIKNVKLEFGADVDMLLSEFTLNNIQYSELEAGEYLFKELKMTIANSESEGGEGNGLSYFYAANDIGHLLEDEELL